MSENRGDKKKVAAVAAVLSLLGAESPRASASSPVDRPAGVFQGGGRPGPAPWALYGRQQIMSTRGLLQRRAFRR
jgi:hypothetical protein